MVEFHNTAHLGDCLYQIHYMNKLVEKYNIKSKLYCRSVYHKQLEEFIVNKDHLVLDDISNVTNSSIDCWISKYYGKLGECGLLYDLFYVEVFKELSKIINLESPISNINDMLFDNKELLVSNELTSSIDFLVINSSPLSGQFNGFDPSKFNTIIEKLKDIGNVVTTAPNNSKVPCTLDYNLSLMGIGNLSIHSKNIISIMTSPIIPCFNVYNIDKFDAFLVLENQNWGGDRGVSYSFNNRIKHVKYLDRILEFYK